MNRKLLATAICAALAWPLAATTVHAQEAASQADADQDEDATELDRILVTGSRIPRAQLETASPVITISAERAARQILEACRRGDAELVITVQAKLAVLARTIAPDLFSNAMSLVARLLPRAVGPEGDVAEPGRSAGSKWVPSMVLATMYAAARRNNEL